MSDTPRPFKFLVCVDESDASRVAVRFAARRVQKRGGLLDLVHVLETSELPSLLLMANRVVEHEQRVQGERLLNEYAELASHYGVVPSMSLREGARGEQILGAVTADHDVNILLLGVDAESSGKGKLIPWLASQLTSTLLVPMMLVPGNLTDLQIEELT